MVTSTALVGSSATSRSGSSADGNHPWPKQDNATEPAAVHLVVEPGTRCSATKVPAASMPVPA
ncbi:hypothetical protein ACIBCH_15770 [Amycolatopsis thailandensis]|uniref:hypothetical protein n=1 Tax=Amycolatopsis thailandensis TaxID=589330 RepID=UPI0037ADC035